MTDEIFTVGLTKTSFMSMYNATRSFCNLESHTMETWLKDHFNADSLTILEDFATKDDNEYIVLVTFINELDAIRFKLEA